MWYQFLVAVFLFIVLHTLVWFSTNLQFVKGSDVYNPLLVALLFSIPITLCAFYASRITYGIFNDSAWSVRFLAFGVSYLVFPILTWVMLGESMFTLKTGICIFLSLIIVCVQVFL